MRIRHTRFMTMRLMQTYEADIPDELAEELDLDSALEGYAVPQLDQWVCDNGQFVGDDLRQADDDQLDYYTEGL